MFFIMKQAYNVMFRSNKHSLVGGLHQRLTIFLACLSVYSVIISVFYFKNPVQKFRYLSIHVRSKSFKSKLSSVISR